ncbi:homocysteine S-methyltransferase family protein [Vagococcus fessus]|uniref:Hcy-binding domain-containing protein n=1 Tax=Vagococcus fessus TaxID=120370 RepID=A0A430AC70_9ENTE|nr:homocysteine S-methyltransferase family protein [Vagococcus fessus]RSU04808.1 hypothetical protein CBF31_01970 [Vagococcus fessus]
MTNSSVLLNETLVFDGGKGTEILKRGYVTYPLDKASVDSPNVVKEVHQLYIDSGADVLTTNTFRLTSFSEKYEMERVISADYQILKEISAPYIALSIGPGDADFSKLNTIEKKELSKRYKWQAELGDSHDIDLILLETVCNFSEAVMAVNEIKAVTQIPLAVTCTLTDMGQLISGEEFSQFIVKCEELGVSAVGLNCLPIDEDLSCYIKTALKETSLPLIIQPNISIPSQAVEDMVYSVKEQEFLDAMEDILNYEQIKLVGGCCGTTPELISKLKARVDNRKEV